MKKISAKTSARPKSSGRKGKYDKPLELDRGWGELEAQADRLKSDWMSLSVQLGIGGQDKAAFD
jgi:hypothetical protein